MIKIKYTVKRENGYTFTRIFQIQEIENGEVKQWIDVNFITEAQITRNLLKPEGEWKHD